MYVHTPHTHTNTQCIHTYVDTHAYTIYFHTGGHTQGRHGCSPLVSLDPLPEPEPEPVPAEGEEEEGA
jgi:hypothetical protein